MPPLLRTLLRLSPALAAWSGGGVVLLLLVRWLVPDGVLANAHPAAGDFLQAVATIEAVLLAFVVFAVWQQFEDARREVAREANDLADLERVARGLPEPDSTAVRALVRRYAFAVLVVEWPCMAVGDEGSMRQTWSLLDEMWGHLQRCRPGTGTEEHLHAEALQRFGDLSDSRISRLTSARRRMPHSLVVLLYVGAFIVVMASTLLPVGSLLLHSLMVGALAGALSHVLWVIHDLNDTFAGDWQVPRAPFERLLERLGEGGRGE